MPYGPSAGSRLQRAPTEDAGREEDLLQEYTEQRLNVAFVESKRMKVRGEFGAHPQLCAQELGAGGR